MDRRTMVLLVFQKTDASLELLSDIELEQASEDSELVPVVLPLALAA